MPPKKPSKTLQKAKNQTLDGSPLIRPVVRPEDVSSVVSVKQIQDMMKKPRKK